MPGGSGEEEGHFGARDSIWGAWCADSSAGLIHPASSPGAKSWGGRPRVGAGRVLPPYRAGGNWNSGRGLGVVSMGEITLVPAGREWQSCNVSILLGRGSSGRAAPAPRYLETKVPTGKRV